jgi:hypothetical protein
LLRNRPQTTFVGIFTKNQMFHQDDRKYASIFNLRETTFLIITIAYSVVISYGNYWTSGSDLDCPNKFFWCSKESEFAEGQVPWQSGHPDSNAGDCVHAEIGKDVLFATNNCSTELNFVCETRKKGTDFQGLTFECMDFWDVSEGLQLD